MRKKITSAILNSTKSTRCCLARTRVADSSHTCANIVKSRKLFISDAIVASARIVAKITPTNGQNLSETHYSMCLTIPDALWPIVRRSRLLHKVLMDAAIAAINDTFSYKHRNGRLTAGAIVVLHPFSKRMGNNSHLHVLVTEGGFDKCGRFIHQKIIPFNAM